MNLCGTCGTHHFGPCTKGTIEARQLRERIQERQEKIQSMRGRLYRARCLNDAREVADVLSDLLDMIEGEQ